MSDPRRVIDFLINMEFSSATTHLDKWARRGADFEDLKFYRAMVVVARAKQSGGEQRERLREQALQQLLEVVAAKAKSDDTPLTLLNIGLAKAFIARIYLDQERWFKAYRFGRAARNELRSLIKRYPEAEDAYLVLGLYEFYTGSVPTGLKWLMALIDLSGDRGKGLRYLERAVAHAPVAAPEAARVLIYELPLEAPEVCRYIPLVKEMRHRYPENPLFTLRLQRVYRICGHPRQALEENHQAKKTRRPNHWFSRELDWEALHIYRDLGNLNAIESLRVRFQHRPEVWLRAKAEAMDVLGRYKQAEAVYRQVDKVEDDELDFGGALESRGFRPPDRISNGKTISISGACGNKGVTLKE